MTLTLAHVAWSLLALVVLVFFGLGLPRYRQNNSIKQWRRTLNLDYHGQCFAELFAHSNGFLLSQQARQQQDAWEYLYGEIEFLSFIALISLAHPNESTHFYDLGSGIGKATIACAMVFNPRKSYGIELFEQLHVAAIAKKNQLEHLPAYAKKARSIEFVHDNFLNVDLNDATLIFINATAFIGEIWEHLSQKLADTAKQATIITISKKVKSPAFAVTHQTEVAMSWGVATAYIQTSC